MRILNTNKLVFQDSLKKFPKFIQASAKTLFDKLDPNLDPQIAVVVIPCKENEEIIVVGTDKNNCEPKQFIEIKDFLIEEPIFQSENFAPDVQGLFWQQKIDILEAIRKIINKNNASGIYQSFTITPEFIYGHSVSIILQLSRQALQSYYCLLKSRSQVYLEAESLIHGTINCFLYECLTPLKELSRGRWKFPLSDDGNEALRQAGHWLINTVEKSSWGYRTGSLFYACDNISSLRYEGSESIGKMIVSRINHPEIYVSIHLQKIISLNNYRGIRKLLEITSDDMHLLCDSKGIYGIGKLNNIYCDKDTEDLFTVEFTSHHTWLLTHAKNAMMIVKYGLPSLPSMPISQKDFQDRIREKFSNLIQNDLDILWQLVNTASKQKHGTMLVISDRAEEEAERLANQSTTIKPIKLTSELVLPLSSIDGALLIDPKATCYSIGVILDGISTEKGDPSRGARFNSAIRYLDFVNNQDNQTLIVVISEDGIINIM